MIIQKGSNNINVGLKMYLNRSSLIPKDRKENVICTTDDVRGDFLGPPHGTIPAAVIENKT